MFLLLLIYKINFKNANGGNEYVKLGEMTVILFKQLVLFVTFVLKCHCFKRFDEYRENVAEINTVTHHTQLLMQRSIARALNFLCSASIPPPTTTNNNIEIHESKSYGVVTCPLSITPH